MILTPTLISIGRSPPGQEPTTSYYSPYYPTHLFVRAAKTRGPPTLAVFLRVVPAMYIPWQAGECGAYL